jgi:hypothetical protein
MEKKSRYSCRDYKEERRALIIEIEELESTMKMD